MRILVVTTWFPTSQAPHRTPFIRRHIQAVATVHDVHVVHVELMRDTPAQEAPGHGFTVTRVGLDPRKPLSVLRTLRCVRRWARGADVVHTMAFSSALVAAPAVWRRLWVHTEHWNGVLYPEHVNAVWRAFRWLRWILRAPRLVTGVSSVMVEGLRHFSRPGAVRRVGNVVDYNRMACPLPPKPPVRLIAVGAATEHKGILIAVETVAWLVRSGVDAHLTWAGTGPVLPQAQRLARELGVSQKVHLPGHVQPPQLWDLLDAAHVFVLPSRSETFCVAAAEALAAGRPVVMGARGGQRDIVGQHNGRLVEERTASAFGAAIVDLLADPSLSSAQEISCEVQRRYGAAAIAGELDALYREAAR